MIVGRRAPGITRSACHQHLRDVHGQMVVRPPVDAGPMPKGYVQNHVFDGAYPAGHHAHAVERDMITELWFDDIADLRASTGTPYYLNNLKPDEPKFVDDDIVEKMVVRPQSLSAVGAGKFKLFLLLSAGEDVEIDDAQLAALDEKVQTLPRHDGVVRNLAQSPPNAPQPFVSIIYEAWFASRTDAEAALSSAANVNSSARSGMLDPKRSLTILAEEYTTEQLQALTKVKSTP